jgi:RNA polymerase-associated protein CTR9
LGQIYIHKGDRTKAQESFEKVFKEYPENYETLKILGSLYGRSEHPKNREKGASYLRKVTQMRPEDVFAWLELASLEERMDKPAAIKS